jgi:hypothetical protein
VFPGPSAHAQGGEDQGAQEYDDSDNQQVKQALSLLFNLSGL